MARLDPKLISKLAEKLKKPEHYIRDQISKRARRNSVNSEAQLVLWLKDEKIGYQTYFNKLTPDIKQQISAQRSVPTPPRTTGSKASHKGNHVLMVGNVAFAETKVLISKQMIRESIENANLYPSLYLFENSLRDFVQRVLSNKFGKNWWDTKVNTNIQGSVKSRIKKEEMNPWHGKRTAIHPLYYTDLADLTTIIRNHQKEFSEFFKEVPGGLNWLTQKLDEIYLSRNNIAHTSPLSKADATRFNVYFADWYKQLVNIEKML